MNIKATLTTASIACFISVSLISCDWIINKKNKNIFSVNQSKVNTKKDEARLLVQATQNNLDVIELCQIIKEAKPVPKVKTLADDLENVHKNIFNAYEALAQDKLISIPRHSNIVFQTANDSLNEIESRVLVEANLERITEKLVKHIELLETLSKTTNNKDFRRLSKKTDSVLTLKLVKTEDTLSWLKAS